MADEDSWDADSFEPDEPIKKASGNDKWEGEDEEEDVKENWDEEEEEDEDEEKAAERPTEVKSSEKKKLSEKIKEKEDLLKQKQEEHQKRSQAEESELTPELKPTEKLREDSDVESASDTCGGTSNHVAGIDAISPSSKDDFTVFENLLKDKITPYDKSVHYCSFLESLFRNLCTPLEVEELKRVSNGLTVLLTEKQKQEKSKGKKKKKGVVPGGGLKAKMKDDLADYGEFDGGYTQDYEDFM